MVNNKKILEIARTMLEENLTYVDTVKRFEIKSIHVLKIYIYDFLPDLDFKLYSNLVKQFENEKNERRIAKITEAHHKRRKECDLRKIDTKYIRTGNNKKVKNLKTGEIYISQNDAARKTGFTFTTINNHCNNKVKKPIFQYV